MKKKRAEKTKKAVLLMLIAVILGFTAAMMVYSFYYVDKVEVYDMKVEVGDRAGFDVDNKTLAFGIVIPESTSSTRYFSLDNNENYPVKVEFKTRGDMAKWVSLNQAAFIMEPGTNMTIPVSVSVPYGTKTGNYTGSIKAVFKKYKLI
ncbi:MAG: hypothetical protein KKE20_02520 [Nanoarchaeota archaeon]|nr:hypothetical protein [Nanoarchaeota archaeon]